MLAPNCPVEPIAREALEKAGAFERAVRRLRRSMLACDRCVAVDDCPLRQSITAQIRAVLAEIAEELDLEHGLSLPRKQGGDCEQPWKAATEDECATN